MGMFVCLPWRARCPPLQRASERVTSKSWVRWVGHVVPPTLTQQVTLGRFSPTFSCVVRREAQHAGLPPHPLREPFCVLVY